MLEDYSVWSSVWIFSISSMLAVTFLIWVEKWLLFTPESLPWLGDLKGMLPRISSCLRDRTESISGIKAGYVAFGSKGKPFIRPDVIFRPQVLVPQEHIRWVLDQPEEILSIHQARYEKFALNFVLPERDAAVDKVFLDTIHHKMTRNLLKLQGAFAEEVSSNMDKALGTDSENWVEVNVWFSVEKTVFSALMRILVGQSICREDSFREELNRFTKAFGFSSIFIGRMLPKLLKPTLGWLFSCVTLVRQRRLLKKWFIPLVEERFANLSRKYQDPDFDYTPPDDLVTWASDALLKTGNVERCSPRDLSRRLAIMIPAAVPAIKITTTNVIYDILSSPPDIKIQQCLYNEVADALDVCPDQGWADQKFLPRLNLLNSTVRETMRCNPVSIITSERKVIAKDGVTLPSGEHLPRGTWLGVPTVGIQYDEDVYSDAATYDPFRFCREKSGGDIGQPGATIISTGPVNVTDTFLAFGAGKYACPGRWLATHVMKLSIAYLVYNYELKPLSRRPLNGALFGTNLPDRNVTMMVRRRKH